MNGYRWIINDRGYANVVEVSNENTTSSDEVWGLVYALSKPDEAGLDVNEGVPFAYTKEHMMVDFWPVQKGGPPSVEDVAEKVEMLVYIDRKRVKEDVPKKEYIYRMNMGIKDALKEGMPREYVDGVMRRFIPDAEGKEEDRRVEELARRQAVEFVDED